MVRLSYVLIFLAAVLSCAWSFNLGVKNVKCNLNPADGEINDPCGLYLAVCKGSHCACASGYKEDEAMKQCKPTGKKKDVSYKVAFDDLPHDIHGPGDSPGPSTTPAGFKPNKPFANGPSDNHSRGGHSHGNGHNNHTGEKAGGSVGGFLSLIMFGFCIYYCCFKGRGQSMRGRVQGIPVIGPRFAGPPAPAVYIDNQQVPPMQPGQPMQPYPGQPGQPMQPYPGQPGQPMQPYPGQPGQPMQPYPGQPGQPMPQPYPGQPPQQPYADQPTPQAYPGQQAPMQGYPGQPQPMQSYPGGQQPFPDAQLYPEPPPSYTAQYQAVPPADASAPPFVPPPKV